MIPEKTGYKVYEIMNNKPVILNSDSSVRDCARDMAKYDVGSIIVSENNRIVGIITEEDIVRKFVLNNLDADKVKISDIMTIEPFTIEPEADISDAINMMKELDIRHIPVTKNEEIFGMLTAKDIIRIQPELLETFKIDLEDEPEVTDIDSFCDVCGKKTNVFYHIDDLNVCEKCYEEYVRKRKY